MDLTKRNTLHIIDFIVLSVIFFGYATYLSISYYLFWGQGATTDITGITDSQNWDSIILEIVMLFIAGAYLYFRKFDFKSLNFSVDKVTIPWILLLLIVGAGATDAGLYFMYWLFPPEVPVSNIAGQITTNTNGFSHISVPLILFSLLNGGYEELFFIGLVFAVNEKQRPYAIVGSLFVRFIFHTYQGIPVAVGIMLMGLVFILIRRKVHSLVPFMLAHAVFDTFGASLYYWIYMIYYSYFYS